MAAVKIRTVKLRSVLPHLRHLLLLSGIGTVDYTDDEIIEAVMHVCPEYHDEWPTDEEVQRIGDDLHRPHRPLQ